MSTDAFQIKVVTAADNTDENVAVLSTVGRCLLLLLLTLLHRATDCMRVAQRKSFLCQLPWRIWMG